MIEIVPAIDLLGGKCVRLTQGDFDAKKEYGSDPLGMARRFKEAGLRRLHLVDLDGARQGRVVQGALLKAIVAGTGSQIEFGGGIASDADIEMVFANGAVQAVCGSVAVKQRPLFEAWLRKYGKERIVLAADTKGGMVAISGWKDIYSLPVLDFISLYFDMGVEYVLCTDVTKDGELQGPAFELYRMILKECPGIKLIASGGVASLDDIRGLDALGVHAVVVGKALYEGRIKPEELVEMIC
jgi:phosphoribosylformimino-5-aminoimidazole carboxamide ribotide isomerase